jgi:hypothetical protein
VNPSRKLANTRLRRNIMPCAPNRLRAPCLQPFNLSSRDPKIG